MESENTAPMNAAAGEPAIFSFDEMRSLQDMRARYARQGDVFTAEEMARLEFLRWLHCTGRLAA